MMIPKFDYLFFAILEIEDPNNCVSMNMVDSYCLIVFLKKAIFSVSLSFSVICCESSW